MRPTVRVEESGLLRFAERLLVAAGASPENARAAAEIFVEADLKGVGPQGVDYLYYVVDSLKRGLIDGRARPRIARETPSTALIDGQRGFGQPAALLAVDVATAKARATGSAAVVIGNSTDIFMIGAYAERLAANGLIGLVMTSGPPLVHPHGGTERMMSTNPLAFAFPRAGDPFVHDMATSAYSSSRVRQAAYHGEQLPPGSGVGADGAPTTDAATIRKGAIAPMAEHRGFGLSLAVALLCGPLSGSGVGPDLGGWQHDGETEPQGHFVQAWDPAAFGDPAEFIRRSERYFAQIKNSRKAPGVAEIRIPGERAAQVRRAQREDGIEVLSATWTKLAGYAKDLGVAMPQAR
ncbi:MAG: Ldh family oxidoreductase [Alphaproteobacteria bacterium]|nr:Ldh family oxidoreductase [Alphaproteobacteria bacterium]